MYIPLNTAAYSPNTLNDGFPKQATQAEGRGFFTAPGRTVSGNIVRSVSSTFADVWSQPRLFFNSLSPVQQQFVINAMRFESSHLKSDVVKKNVLIQLNRISHDIATRVAEALGMTAPEADDKYYHNNKTIGVNPGGEPLLKIEGLKVGYLTSKSSSGDKAKALKAALKEKKVGLTVVAESLGEGIDQTYSATSAVNFDAIIVDGSAASLFAPAGSLAHSNSTAATKARSTLYPAGRPLDIVQTGYNFGKPVGVLGASNMTLAAAGIEANTPGVYAFDSSSDMSAVVEQISEGLRTFKFLDRYPLDE
jgi:catalase